MYRQLSTVLVCTLLAALPAAGTDLDAQCVFEQLTTLTGTWRGVPEGEGEHAAAEAEAWGGVVHEFELSAAGTVVMETMNPGSDSEMINMYHVDGEDLVLTHYCAGGNQPSMRLNRETSTSDKLVFDFTGGTNLDPAVDEHIHAAQVTLVDTNHLESVWTGYKAGESTGAMIFHLVRSE
jgi:hypothetical protein